MPGRGALRGRTLSAPIDFLGVHHGRAVHVDLVLGEVGGAAQTVRMLRTSPKAMRAPCSQPSESIRPCVEQCEG